MVVSKRKKYHSFYVQVVASILPQEATKICVKIRKRNTRQICSQQHPTRSSSCFLVSAPGPDTKRKNHQIHRVECTCFPGPDSYTVIRYHKSNVIAIHGFKLIQGLACGVYERPHLKWNRNVTSGVTAPGTGISIDNLGDHPDDVDCRIPPFLVM
jgi:hypothetical protein